MREAILAVVEPHWQTSWKERVYKMVEQVQVDRKDVMGVDSLRYYRIRFLNVPYLAYFIPNAIGNGSVPTWTFPGNGSRVVDKQLSHWTGDGHDAQRNARNLVGLGHTHEEYEILPGYNSYRPAHYQCPASCGYDGKCVNDGDDDVPMNLWYTVLLTICKTLRTFGNTTPVDPNKPCKNSVYVPLQHDPRLLYSAETYDDKGNFVKWVPLKAGEWHKKVGAVCVGGKPDWSSFKEYFINKLHAGFQSTMLDVLFPHSLIKREIGRQVLKQMTPITYLTQHLQIGNQTMLQWEQRSIFDKHGNSCVDTVSYPKLNTTVVNRYPVVEQTWLTPSEGLEGYPGRVSANIYLDAVEWGELLAWMDTCNQDILNISDFFKASSASLPELKEFPSSDDHFPDHTDPRTFRGRLAQTAFPKAVVFYHSILAEVAESTDENSGSTGESSELGESSSSKRLRFLKPVAKIIHNYLPFPTTTPRAGCTRTRIGFTQFA